MTGLGMGAVSQDLVLARRFAVVRICLAVANFAVIYLDHTVPEVGTISGYSGAYGAAGLFLGYSLLFWVALTAGRGNSSRLSWVSSVLDVFFGGLLIVVTNGYRSPFNIWLVFAVIHSGFSRHRGLPVLVAILSVVMHAVIATVPQDQPLDVSVFAVRTIYLFGVAALMATIGGSFAAYSNALVLGAGVGNRLGAVTTCQQAGEVLLEAITSQFKPLAVRIDLENGESYKGRSQGAEGGHEKSLPLMAGPQLIGRLHIHSRTHLSARDDKLLRILCNQTAAALKRIQLVDCLAEEAAQIERLRILDQMHDTIVQTLTALDLRIEATRLAAGNARRQAPELDAAAALSHQALSQIRGLLDDAKLPAVLNPAALRQVIAQRWSGEATIDIAPDTTLSPDQWSVAQMLVKEGVNNICRHGCASRISLRLFRDDSGATVCSLSNNGVTPAVPPRLGYGLSRLRDAAARAGGGLRFDAVHPTGAVLEVSFNGHHPGEITRTGDRLNT